MPEYLPEAYTGFRQRYPDDTAALDAPGSASAAAGPPDDQSQRLIKLGFPAAIAGLEWIDEVLSAET